MTDDEAIKLSESITLLPEYHLTGYDKGKSTTQDEAAELASVYGHGCRRGK